MAGTLWSDVESSPWFPDLSPEEKAQTLDNWLGYALEREEDPDKALEISAYAEARKKNFFGESVPQDQIFRPLVERRFDTRKQVSDRYNQFARGELQDPEMEGLDQVFKDRADSKVVNGSVFVKPSLIWDEGKYKEAVKNSGAPKVEQALALQEFKPLREQASKSMVESLALTDEDFKGFAESGVAAGKSNTEILDEWRAAMKLPEGIFGTIQGIGRQLSYGISGGLAGLERAGAGVGAILGIPGAQEAAEAAGKEAQSFAARRGVEGGPSFVGDVAEGAVSLVPTIGVGAAGAALAPVTGGTSLALTGLAAGSLTGGLQSAGASQADSYEYRRNVMGESPEQALAGSRYDAAASGLITTAVTAVSGKLGDKLGLGRGVEGLFRTPTGRAALRSGLRSGVVSTFTNATEEGIEEATDQLLQGVYERYSRDPNKDFQTILEEAVQAGKIGAPLGGGLAATRSALLELFSRTPQTATVEQLEQELAARDAAKATPEAQNELGKAAALSAAAANAEAAGAPAVAQVTEQLAQRKVAEVNLAAAEITQGLTDLGTVEGDLVAGLPVRTRVPAPTDLQAGLTEAPATEGDLLDLIPQREASAPATTLPAVEAIAPVVGLETPQPQETNAPQERQIAEDGQLQYPNADEGRTPAEAGSRDLAPEGGQVSQEDVTPAQEPSPPEAAPAPKAKKVRRLGKNPQQDYDLLDFLQENNISIPKASFRKGKGEWDWLEKGDLKSLIPFIGSYSGQPGGNVDTLAQQAFDFRDRAGNPAPLISDPSPDALIEGIRSAWQVRRQARSAGAEPTGIAPDAEKVRKQFERQAYKKRTGQFVDPKTLNVGDKLTIGDVEMEVVDLTFPEDEAATDPSSITLSGGRFGRQVVGTDEPLRIAGIERRPEVAQDDFALEAVTPEQLDAEAEVQRQRDLLRERQAAPLTGTAGDIGTPDMFDNTAGETPLLDQPQVSPVTGIVPTESLPADTQPTSGDVGTPSEATRILRQRIAGMVPKAQESWTPELLARAEQFFQNPEQSLGDVPIIKARAIRESYLESLPEADRAAQQARWDAEARRAGQVGSRTAPAPEAAPAVAPEPAPTPIAAEQPPAPVSEKIQKVRAKRDNLFAKFGRKSGQVSMGIDPELVSIAAEIAGTYVEEGVIRFADFAARVKADAGALWDQIRGYLRNAWNQNADANPELDEVSRAQAEQVFAALDAAPAPTETPAAAEPNFDTVEDTIESPAEQAADPLNAPLGFGGRGRRNKSVRELLGAGETNYLFRTLFDDAQMRSALESSPADVQRVRDLVRELEEYQNFVREQATSPAEWAERNAPFKEETDRALVGLRDAGFTASVDENGRVLLRDVPKVYRSMLREFGFEYDPRLQNHANPSFEKFLGFAQAYFDDVTGQTTERNNRSPDGRARARFQSGVASQNNESALSATDVDEFLATEIKERMFSAAGTIPMQALVEQAHDAALITKAQQTGKPMFMLASEAGTGKTYVMAAALSEMRRKGVRGRILYVTNNQVLIEQTRKVFESYGLSDVEFSTYSKMDDQEGFAPSPTDVLVLDEAHNVRYRTGDEASSRAMIGGKWMEQAKFTLMASATPFESIEQMHFLWPTGVFELVPEKPYGNAERGWFNFGIATGGKVLRRSDGTPVSVKFPENPTPQELLDNGAAARGFLEKNGMFVQRSAIVPEGAIDSNFVSVPAEPNWERMSAIITELARETSGLDWNTRAYLVNLLKRISEYAKIPAAIEQAKREIAEGRHVAIFLDSKSERTRDLEAIVDEWDAYKEMGEEVPESFTPKIEGVIEFFRSLIATGITEINFDSAQKLFREGLGAENVAFYTGDEAGAAGNDSLGRWRAGEVPVLVATMARGGTGLSLHDTSEGGVEPRSQIVLTLPWRATETEQVAKRIARYGMTSKARIFWLFSPNLSSETLLASRVGGRMQSMSTLVNGVVSEAGSTIQNWQFDPILNDFTIAPDSPLTAPSEGMVQLTKELNAYLSSEGFPGRIVGPVTESQLEAGLKSLSKLLPNVRRMVRIAGRSELLRDESLPETAKNLVRNGAQGFHYNGLAYVVRENVRQLAQHKTPEVAAQAVIFHELMHRGSKLLREAPQFRALYRQWQSMVAGNVSGAELDALVRMGYTSLSGWRNNADTREAAQEEVFVRKLEDLLNREGTASFQEAGVLRRFFNWLQSMLNKVFGNPPSSRLSDDLIRDWGRKYVQALNGANTLANFEAEVQPSMTGADAEYMRAVEANDLETAQRLVDQAARAAGHDPDDVYFWGARTKDHTLSEIGDSLFVTDSYEAAKDYAHSSNEPQSFFFKGKVAGAGDISFDWTIWPWKEYDLEGEGSANDIDLGQLLGNRSHRKKVVDDLVSQGYDALYFTGDVSSNAQLEHDSWLVFSPSQIKSADPITYDDKGNVIPLSQRFQPDSPDIRFSVAPVEQLPESEGTRRTPLDSYTEEQKAAILGFAQQSGSNLKLTQVLGMAEAGNVGTSEQLAPLRNAAMRTIGFTADADGKPVISAAATANAKSIALQLLDPKSNFGNTYQLGFGAESAATAVLQMELARYALAMMANGDSSLIGMLRRNWNSVMLGTYLSATSAGRVLRARSYYVSDVLSTLEQFESEQSQKVADYLGSLGVDGPQTLLEEVEQIVAQAELDAQQRFDLREALENNRDAAKVNELENDRNLWLRGIELMPDSIRSLYEELTLNMKELAFLEQQEQEMLSANAEPEASRAVGDMADQQFARSASLEELRARREAILERNREVQKAFEAALRRTARPAPTPEGPTDNEADTTIEDADEGGNEATEAAKTIIDELKAFLEKKYTAKAPPETAYTKIKAIIDRSTANVPEYNFDQFSSEIEAEVEGMEIDAEVLEELIAKAWSVYLRLPEKTAQKMAAEFEKIANGLVRQQKVEQTRVTKLKELARESMLNSKGLPQLDFVAQLTPKFQALGVPAADAARLAEWTYNAGVTRKAERRKRKIEGVKQSLFGGSLSRLIKRLEKATPAEQADLQWRTETMFTVLKKSGLTDSEANELLNGLTDAEFDSIFTVHTGLADANRARSLQDQAQRLIKRYEELVKRPKTEQEKVREFKLETLARNQLKVALTKEAFVAEAKSLGATEAQAERLYALTEEQRNLTVSESAQKRAQDLLALYRQIGTRTKSAKEAAQDAQLVSLVNEQISTPKSEADFVAQATNLGLTEEQAKRVFRAAEPRSPTLLSKLTTYILSAPEAIRNVASNRDLAIREFLKQNGLDEARIEEAMKWIGPQFDEYIKQAKQKALDAKFRSLESAKERANSRFATMSDSSVQQLQSDLKLIRAGLGDFDADPTQLFAKKLGYTGFRPEDYRTLAELDFSITRARENGLPHDMARGLKELYELLARRKMPKTFWERMAIAYNNSALSGLGTLLINIVAPLGSLAVRVGSDMARAIATGRPQDISAAFKILADSFKSLTQEINFSLVGGANINAMQQQISRVTNLQQDFNKALKVWRNKEASPVARLKAGFVIAQSATDVTRRILATTDHTWYAVMQNYFVKTEALRVLTDAGIPRETSMPMLFARTQENGDLLASSLSRISEIAKELEAAFKADPASITAKLTEILEAPIDERLSDSARSFEVDLRAALRRTAVAYQINPTSIHRHLMAELKLQQTSAYLRASDIASKQMLAGVQKLVDPAGDRNIAEQIEQQGVKESEYELGTHRGEQSPFADVANMATNLIIGAGSAVLAKNPIFGRMLLGYFGIPANLLNRALWFTPYGLIRYGIASKAMKTPEGRAKFYQQSMNSASSMRQRLVEAVLGTTATTLLLAMKALGDDEDEVFNVTLAGPVNKTEYDAWYKMGNRRGSIQLNIGDRVFSLNWARGPLEPLKVALMLVGAVDDMRLNRKLGDTGLQVSLSDYLSAVLSGWSQQASFFGAKTTVGAVFGTQANAGVAGNLVYKASPFIPFSGLVASVERLIIGPDQFRGRESAVFSNLPIFRSLLSERAVNALGDPLGMALEDPFSNISERLWYAGLPFTIQKKLTGNEARIYQLFLDKGVAPGLPSRASLESKNGLMWDTEWLAYVERRGEALKKELTRNLARFYRMDEDSLRPALAELTSKATRATKRKLNLK